MDGGLASTCSRRRIVARLPDGPTLSRRSHALCEGKLKDLRDDTGQEGVYLGRGGLGPCSGSMRRRWGCKSEWSDDEKYALARS